MKNFKMGMPSDMRLEVDVAAGKSGESAASWVRRAVRFKLAVEADEEDRRRAILTTRDLGWDEAVP